MKRRANFVAAGVLSVLLTACGTAPSPHPEAAPHRTPAVKALRLGAVSLRQGSVWLLDNPGDGTPRESITIESIRQRQVSAVVYLSEFGSLIDTTLHGTAGSNQRLKLVGTVSDSTITGSVQTEPMTLVIQPVNRHTIWVTQHIQGDSLVDFSQIAFHS
ncbi:MAG: hypothetical protein OWU84_05545 [Firmicutes bacterium]|nr:hypothetical protein [Bacillota bacterium]